MEAQNQDRKNGGKWKNGSSLDSSSFFFGNGGGRLTNSIRKQIYTPNFIRIGQLESIQIRGKRLGERGQNSRGGGRIYKKC